MTPPHSTNIPEHKWSGAFFARLIHMLSFGQKRRVAIAGAISVRPEILLLDEPTAGEPLCISA